MGGWFSTNKPQTTNEPREQPKEEPTANQDYFLEKPWRTFESEGAWCEKYANKLIDDINSIKIEDENIKNLNIPLVGLVKAGKSSFINIVASIDKGRMSQVTNAGGAGKSLTKKLKRFKPKQRLCQFKLFDTMGLQGDVVLGMHIKDLVYLVDGNIPTGYEFNPANPINVESPKFNKNPTPEDKMHCVVIVMDANIIGNENIPEDAKEKVQAIMEELEFHEIPTLILLTKIDFLCEKVDSDIKNTYWSKRVKDAVEKARVLFTVPEQNIFPIKNYREELATDHNKEILILLVLRQILRFAADFLNVSNQDSDSDKEEET